MKKQLVSVFYSCIILLCLAALPRVAVLDIIALPGIDASVVVPVTETIMEEVVGARAYVVLDRAYVEQVLKEMEFELSGLVGDTQAAKAGQFLGADYVVAGKVQMIGDAYFLVAKLIEVRSGVIVAQASEQGEGKLSTLLGMSRQVGRKLVAGSPISPLEPAMREESAAKAGSAIAAPVTTDPAPAEAGPRRFAAGFLMGGTAKYDDVAVVAGINRLKAKHAAWLDLIVAEEVTEETCAAEIDRLVETEKCDIVISVESSFAEELKRAAARYPNIIFQCDGGSWDDSVPENYGVIGLNESKHWYLEGLVAGSLSSSGKIGLLSESVDREPWWRQTINAFALGVKAANPKAQILVDFRPAGHWENQESDVAAARALVAKGCDFIWGINSPQLAWALEELAKGGQKARAFLGDFSYTLAPAVVVSGPMRDVAVLHEKSLIALRDGNWKSEAYYPTEASSFGGGGMAFNPAFLSELQAKKIKTPDRGTLPLLELLELRRSQIASGQFEPFTGPIKDQKGATRLQAGVRADWKVLESIDWFVDNVKTTGL
ncbi:MAG: BMP family ABC transporter substrate-binding protein [Spirochaetaceae bacterium]|nr:BMP family ABC transporter substrate-binding protein [Spirochaetaceae bacterium]